MKKFSGCYRIPSARATWWNYDQNGIYHITICTLHHRCILGKIHENVMILSDIGQIVDEEWKKSFNLRQELNCEIYTIMPNHIHAIVSIFKPEEIKKDHPVINHGIAKRKPQSVSSFVAGFKAAVTSQLRQQHLANDSIWLPRFYDNIILNKHEYQQIEKYILTNPTRWKTDEYFRSMR